MLVDVAYVGNRSNDLLLLGNCNQAAPNDAAGSIPLQARRPIPEFADITYVFNGGRARYHALQFKYEWRPRADVSVLSSLTLSRAKDNGAGYTPAAAFLVSDNRSSGGFGTITSTYDPRQLQLGVKLLW